MSVYRYILLSTTNKKQIGVLRGLETFAQLVRWLGSGLQYVIGPLPLTIQDKPRFKWRGLMVDTARHFLPIGHIFRTLDGMVTTSLVVGVELCCACAQSHSIIAMRIRQHLIL